MDDSHAVAGQGLSQLLRDAVLRDRPDLARLEFLDQERLDLAFLEHAQLPPTERGANVDSEREFIGLAGPRLHGCADLVQPSLAEDP